ncbi:MAG: MBL fold metallo-hydrolase [Rectinemataceae bacterium]|nr:MBL fold metallo-hydrolase [Rectinemataceae bacterium]
MISRIERLRVGPIGENVYAIQSGDLKEAAGVGILVDPGDDADAILRFLAEKGITVSLIVLTHGHLDHTAALPDLLAQWKGDLPGIAIHRLDAAYLGAKGEATNRELFDRINAAGFFHGLWKPLPEPTIFLADGDIVPGTGLRVLHCPGHSAGSICLYDGESATLISGDTLFRDGVGRTDGPDSDPAALQASLVRLAALPPDTIVFPGHGPRTTIGREL